MEALAELLKRFMLIPGLSGYEKEVAHLFRAELDKYADEVFMDRLGNTIGEIRGTDEKAPVIMVYAHLDQLGFIVRKVEKNGYVQVDRLGGIPEKVLPGIPVLIMTDQGSVNGVIGNKSHHAAAEEEKYKVDKVTSLYIDIGAKSYEEAKALGVDIGCPVVYKPRFERLAGTRVSGTSIDDRGGLAALIHIAQEIKVKRPAATVYLVGTVQEEFNLRGAMMAARTITPDIGICLDVSLAGDTPDLMNRYDDHLGEGPTMSLYSFHGRGTLNGTLPHKGLVDLTAQTARERNIPLQKFASLGILTDSSYLQLEGMGVCALELGFPTRYTHTPVEVCDLQDLKNLAHLVSALVGNIDSTFSLNRF